MPAEFTRFLSRVRAGGQYLNLILTNLLDFSSVESGHSRVLAGRIYLADWMEDLQSIMDPIAQSRGVAIRWELNDPEAEFCTDALRLSQIALNLVHNAVKFSMDDSAPVVVHIVASGSNPAVSLRIRVMDDGPGVAPDQLPMIGAAYLQGETPGRSYECGVGLGLSVVRANVSLLRGEFNLENRAPRGLITEVTLPGLPQAEGGEAAVQEARESAAGGGTRAAARTGQGREGRTAACRS